MPLGYWATHEYRRHSVEVDVLEFCGWDYLLELMNRIDNTCYRVHQQDLLRKRDKGLVSTLFLTGGRLLEVLSLKGDNFDFEDPEAKENNVILVKGMRVLKRYRKMGEWTDEKGKKHWKTAPIFMTRGIFPIRYDTPLTPFMVEWIKSVQNYLFPSSRPDRRHLTETRAYQIIQGLGIDLHLYPHWFRAQRASQLAQERDYRLHKILAFFSWKKAETGLKYAKLNWRHLL